MPFQKGVPLPPEVEARRIAGMKGIRNFAGKRHSEETKKRMSDAQIGKPHHWGLKGDDNPAKRPEVRAKIGAANTGRKRTDEARAKTSASIKAGIASGRIRRAHNIPWNKGKVRTDISGPKNYNWKGGVTPRHEAIRKSVEYKIWRAAIFARDCFTCQICGRHGGDMHADHIKPFSAFPELRFELSNGRTLCVSCHRLTDTYGKKNAAR